MGTADVSRRSTSSRTKSKKGERCRATSKSLVGVDLPRKGGTSQPKTHITLPDGTMRDGQFGCEDDYRIAWVFFENQAAGQATADNPTWS